MTLRRYWSYISPVIFSLPSIQHHGRWISLTSRLTSSSSFACPLTPADAGAVPTVPPVRSVRLLSMLFLELSESGVPSLLMLCDLDPIPADTVPFAAAPDAEVVEA